MFLSKSGHAIYFSSSVYQQFDILRKIDIKITYNLGWYTIEYNSYRF